MPHITQEPPPGRAHRSKAEERLQEETQRLPGGSSMPTPVPPGARACSQGHGGGTSRLLRPQDPRRRKKPRVLKAVLLLRPQELPRLARPLSPVPCSGAPWRCWPWALGEATWALAPGPGVRKRPCQSVQGKGCQDGPAPASTPGGLGPGPEVHATAASFTLLEAAAQALDGPNGPPLTVRS